MSRIDKLLYLAIIPPFLIALTVLTFVVFVHEMGQLSELLITGNASIATVGVITATILPRFLIFTLPLAYLIGILIGLSGLSGESQITALRACGVPVRKMLRPILTLGAVTGLLTALCSLVVLPETNDIVRRVTSRISLRQATSQIQPRIFNEKIPHIVVYLDDLAADRQHWSRVFLVDNSNPQAPRTLLARRGTLISNAAGSRLQLHLEDGTVYEVDPEDPRKDNISVFVTTDIPIDVDRNLAASPGEPPKPFEISTAALWRGTPQASSEARREELIELHRRMAIPLTVIPFSLLGLSLGISTKKGGRTSGFVLSLGLVLLFYTLFFNGVRLASARTISPWLGAWSADIILTALGLLLLAGVERHSRLAMWLAAIAPYLDCLTCRLHLARFRDRVRKWDEAIVKASSGMLARFRFPKILDFYVSRGFFVFFFWSLLVCFSLFVILTLFDLLDYIIRNAIPVSEVVDYFVFLTPQILMLVVPMSILLAVLINFSILEKNSEITALKAGGWSLYRIAMPVFLIAGMFCVTMYFLQDYVLPYANVKQDSIRNVIKGKPASTSYVRPHQWILGEGDRIFNYDYYDAGKDTFVGFNVYDVDLKALKILRRIHASRAIIQSPGGWLLEGGWIRDFYSDRQGFRMFTREEFDFPERPGYFQKEIFEPKESSKLTYLQLKDYINYLRKAGYNATELQVALYKKISFPLSCIVMALLGVPFSFTTGKKGAFFGITASVAIAISYWGVFSIFEQLGSYGMLMPLLAAWAPNLLFGATGLVLLFTIRT